MANTCTLLTNYQNKQFLFFGKEKNTNQFLIVPVTAEKGERHDEPHRTEDSFIYLVKAGGVIVAMLNRVRRVTQ